MRRLIFLAIVTVIMAGCGTAGITVRGTQFFIGRIVPLTVVHLCTDRAILYQGGTAVADIRGARPHEVVLSPALYGNDDILMTLQSVDESGNVVFSFAKEVDVTRDNEPERWIVGDVPRGTRCRR